MVPSHSAIISGTSLTKVVSLLKDRIRSGSYSEGHWLPSERALAEELDVHRRVIRAAVSRLTDEGLLVRRPRCRPVIAGSPARRAAARQSAGTPEPPSSRLVALVMWHGGFEQGATAQQRIFWGFARELAQAGYHAVFLDPGGEHEIGSEEENAAREAAMLRHALDHHLTGLIFYAYAYRSNRALIRQVAAQIPLVLIDRMLPGIQTDFVGVDNFAMMRQAAEYLIAQGHRRIAYATLAQPINTTQDRLEGYRAAMRQAGLAEQVLVTTSLTDWPQFDALFRLPPAERPTALLCLSDYVATLASERLDALGVSIPGDVALVGFDNIVQMLPNGVGLTSMAQPFEEIGATAARTLLHRVAHPDAPLEHHELPCPLVIRDSSGS